MNTTERKAVDVLAVMDRGITDLEEGRCTLWTASDVKAMRAVVAELLQALELSPGVLEAVSREAKEIDEVIKEMRDNAKATNSNIMRYFVGRLKDVRTRGMLNHG